VLSQRLGLIYQARLKPLLPTHRDKPRLLKASNNKSQCVKLNSPSVLWSVLPKQINRQNQAQEAMTVQRMQELAQKEKVQALVKADAPQPKKEVPVQQDNLYI